MARLYADENFPFPVVAELRRLGYDVVTIQDRGHGGKGVPDPDVLRAATFEGRTVLTLNKRDFIRLHKTSRTHAGIVACTEDLDFIGQAARIHVALVEVGEMAGQLLRVNCPPS